MYNEELEMVYRYARGLTKKSDLGSLRRLLAALNDSAWRHPAPAQIDPSRP
jgi:hypothetical protein